jgi:hypothetical protein
MNLIEILDKIGLQTTYDGGNDSGFVDEIFLPRLHEHPGILSKEQIEELYKWVKQQVYSYLGYGSWAGNFSAMGTVVYNSETKLIEVLGNHFEWDEPTEKFVKEFDFLSLIPESERKSVDSVNIHFASGWSSWNDTQVRINIREGEWTQTLQDAEDEIKDLLEELKKEYNEDTGYHFYGDSAYSMDELNNFKVSVGQVEDDPRQFDIDPQQCPLHTSEIVERYE